MATLNFQTADQLKKMPVADRNKYLLWIASNGEGPGHDQSGHGQALINIADSGDWGEINYQLPFMQNEIQKFADRAVEYAQRVKEYTANGLTDGAVPGWAAQAQQYIKNLTNQYNNAPDFVKGDKPQTYEQILNDVPAVNPYDTKGGVVYDKEHPTGVDPKYGQPLTLANGQKISPSDASYNDYAKQLGISVPTTPAAGTGTKTPNPVTPQAHSQPFLLGPSQFSQLQKQGLTEADISRQGTAIYLKPTSKFYAQVAPNAGTAGSGGSSGASGASSGTGGVAAGTDANVGTDPSSAVPKPDQDWINATYQKYFDRNATSAELLNWQKESPAALSQFLASEAKKYNYTSKAFQDSDAQRLTAALDIINNSNLPPDIKQLWTATVKGYPSGMEYNASEILNTFNQIKQDTIDPHFKELADIASKDFATALQTQKSAYEMQTEQNNATAGQNIRQAKAGNEASGMTFTGKAIQDLGKDSAYAQTPSDTNAIPTQQPTDGMFYEGNVNQQNRLMASSSALQNKTTIDTLNRSLEKQLGSEQAATAGATVQGGVTGTLNEQKQAQYGSSLNEIINNYKAKQTLNTNINYNQ